ncbi:TonB-dependent outer membrane receptor FecA5 [Pandoraea pneumonica]|uniref:TonB-dependent outer membrane receptor FecA5 n=1 Tax=Pandoraea pneumonica TaxID=2508299 RepID=A0A5E4SH86_9BURK|nr:TonB-dependent receptor [Pandoraea pneumonica]VVD75037.1 TonB-dependent outer membrane receptor FecA5 [Pandoraea pneumonica]
MKPQTTHAPHLTRTVASLSMRRPHLTLTAIALAVLASAANAQTSPTTDIGDVSASDVGAPANATAAKSRKAPTEAAAKALTQAPLEATSPQTQISSDYIANQVNPQADYGTILRIAPSYSSSSPNGLGLSEAKNQTLRGFPDGQFNVTYDGIPFGDTNDFSHHTTSYFPAATIGGVTIDRSPGNATTLGYATFGGSVNLFSPTLSPERKIEYSQTIGSHATWQENLGITTGIMPGLLDSNVFLNIQRTDSNGALSNSGVGNTNIFLKGVTPIGSNTLVTWVYAYDKIHFNNPGGATLNQVAQYGYNYGLNADPKSPNYWGYNYQDKNTEFAYIDVKHNFDNGWGLSNKLYTYYYYNLSHELNGDNTSSPLSALSAAKPFAPGQSGTDIAGALKLNEYRTYGDTLAATHTDAYGTFTGGFWFEHTRNPRNRFAYDATTGQSVKQNATYGNTYYDMVDEVNTAQAFAQYAWKATNALTVTPGIRYQHFERSLSASVLQNNLPGTSASKSWDSVLPSLDVNYRFTSLWSGYAQVSRGALGPNLNTMYSANPSGNNNVQPQTSMAYQIGTVFKADRFTFNADAYLIEFSNYITKNGSGANATYFNAGGVRYTGIEAEGNVLLGSGFSFYANGSLNNATYTQNGTGSQIWKSGQRISFVPQYTAAVALNFDQGPWHAGINTKFVGSMYQGSNGAADGSIYKVGPYSVTSMMIARDFTNLSSVLKKVRVSFGIDNLFDTHRITDNLGPAATDTSKGTDANQFLYYFVPGRSFYVNLRAEI